MNSVGTTIQCGGCGKSFAWKDQYANHKVKCKCGFVNAFGSGPPMPPAAPTAESSFDEIALAAELESAAAPTPASEEHSSLRADDGDYDIAPRPVHPAPRGATLRHAPVPTLQGTPAGAGRSAAVLPYRGGLPAQRRREPSDDEQQAEYNRKEFLTPAILIAVGLLMTFVEARLVMGRTDVLLMGAYVCLTTIINLPLIFVSLLITAKLLDLGLGEVGPALLKVSAVAILPSACGGIIDALVPFIGGYVSWGVSILMYSWLLYWLFEMDFQEMSICTAIIWVIRTWIGMFILIAIFRAMGGMPTSPSAGGTVLPGGGTTAGPTYVVPGDGTMPGDDDEVDPDQPKPTKVTPKPQQRREKRLPTPAETETPLPVPP